MLSSNFGPIDEYAGSAFKDWRPAQESPPVETDGWYSKPFGSGLKNPKIFQTSGPPASPFLGRQTLAPLIYLGQII
jgi:hypothetical protein